MNTQQEIPNDVLRGFSRGILAIGMALMLAPMTANAVRTPLPARPAELPVPYEANVTKLQQGPASSQATCAVMVDSGVLCWGGNYSGALGVGDTDVHTTPVRAAITGVVELVSTGSGLCALLSDSTVKCWGNGSEGLLGDGQTIVPGTIASLPVQVVDSAGGPALHGVTQISAGDDFYCARMNTGVVRCWGDNARRVFGDGTQTDSSVPVTVTGLSNVKAVSAANYHVCALMDDTGVKCWGGNDPLGDGTSSASPSPVSVHGIDGVGLLTGVITVSGGFKHSCAILNTGREVCWGGELSGNATRTGDLDFDNLVPTYTIDAALQPLTGVVQHTGGAYDSCLRLIDRTVRCWGFNYGGEIGIGHEDLVITPTAMMMQSGEVITDVVDITMGDEKACVLTAGGYVYCTPADNELAALVIVPVPPSADADLIDLMSSPGVLAPGFVSSTTAYTAAVANDVTNTVVTPTLSNPNATYTITGAPGTCTPATSPSNCTLLVGVNTITVTVTAQDGTTKQTYTIEIVREADAPFLRGYWFPIVPMLR
jgi:alpha-tubulin suppressor-like RCC1 family protein